MADTKHTIREVAVDLFFRKGYFATSISDIARGCGIQKASIYYHYPSKEALLFSIMHETLTALMDRLGSQTNGETSIVDKLRAAVRGHVAFHLERQKETFVANSELRGLTPEHYEQIVAKRDAYEQVFLSLIDHGCRDGHLTAADAKILSYGILSLCSSGAFWFRPDGRLSVSDIADIYEGFILRGLDASGADVA